MAEFVYAKHKGVEGLAYLSKTALERLPGWTEASKSDVEAAQKAPAPSRAVKSD